MTAVPRCCAPTDDRPDITDRFGLASPRPVTAGPVGTGGTPPPVPLRPCLPGPSSTAGAPRGAVDATAPMDAKTAPTGACKTAKSAFRTAPTTHHLLPGNLEEHRADLADRR